MPSPFPGMNPYFERRGLWEQFHGQFIAKLQEQLAAQAGDKYVVSYETRLILHELSADERRHYLGRSDGGVAIAGGGVGPAVATRADPATLRLKAPVAVETIKEHFVEIRDLEERRLIAVVELLSPSNKERGPDRAAYISKRKQLIRSGTHFVELDLRRGGKRMQRGIKDCDYAALVKRTESWPKLDVWTWRLRERMPRIPVPIAAPDPDLTIDLKALLDEVHDRGRYAHHLYQSPPEPPLSAEDAAWAAERLAEVAAGP